MKLNNPIQVRDALNDQKRIDIDLGIKLANRVDKVRQNLNEEEMKYQKFHDETIKQIQVEIDNEIFKKESIIKEIKELETKKAKLQEPLGREWERLKKEKLDLKTKSEELGKISVNLVDVIQRNESKKLWNEIETRRIQNLETRITTALNKARKEEQEAEEILEEAKRQASLLVEPLLEREKRLIEGQNEVDVYLTTLKAQKEEIKAEYVKIEAEKIRLADQRGVIERQLKRI